jgi:ribonuclease HII
MAGEGKAWIADGQSKRRACGFRIEKAWLRRRVGAVIAGIDEAGRGPLAGPVVAAAVILPIERCPRRLRSELDDSKKLPAERREELHGLLLNCPEACIGVGRAEVHEIDSVNILNATYRAMGRAVDALARRIDVALVDGDRKPPLAGEIEIETVIGGDGLSLSIAAASIIAKVTRDRLMQVLHQEHPGYGWHTNMGYGTREHFAAMMRLGVTSHHRRSFAPVRAALAGESFQPDMFEIAT